MRTKIETTNQINELKNLKEVNDAYKRGYESLHKRERKHDQQVEDLQFQISAIKQKRSNLKCRSFAVLFQPIINKITKRLEAGGHEWYGPFGLCSANSIYWTKTPGGDITAKGEVLGSLCFVRNSDGWAIRDENKKTGGYNPSSLAALNGMNHPTIELSDKMDIEWLIKFAKRNK